MKDESGKWKVEGFSSSFRLPPSAFILRRLLAFIPVLWAAVTLAFLGLHLTPGDPSEARYAEALISRQELAARRAALGLDRPLPEQYLTFLGDLLRGDLGDSLFSDRPVTTTILEQAGPTAQLALAGLIVATALGLALGVTSASSKSSSPLIQSGSDIIIALSQSLPIAWTGLLGLWLVTLIFRLDTPTLSSLLLPALVLGFATAGPIAVVMRASLVAVCQEPYILAARARGLKPGWPMLRQILPTALVPVINLIALQAAFLFGGTVVTETVFARPGLGRLLVDSLLRKDFPVVQGLVLSIALLYLLFNLAADLTTMALDPRLRSKNKVGRR